MPAEHKKSEWKAIRTLRDTICGQIWLAIYRPTQKLVALKISSKNDSKEYLEDPWKENRLLEKLENSTVKEGRQYVIRLLGTHSFNNGKQLCSIMEFADGGEMWDYVHSLLQDKQITPIHLVQKFFKMIVQAVSFLHNNDVYHMDLSLENILLTREGEIKICDLGVACEEEYIQAETTPRGKTSYMAPEVFARKAYSCREADIWSLGVILWILLTGSMLYTIPAESDARFETLNWGELGLQQLLSVCKITLPDVLVNLLCGMLTVIPKKRLSLPDILNHPWLNAQRPKLIEINKNKSQSSSENE